MEHLGFRYTVISKISVSWIDVEHLKVMAESHYDAKCRSLASPGGLLYGWVNQIRVDRSSWAQLEVEVTERELQSICKVLEGPLAHLELRARFNQLLKEVHRELARIHNESGG